MKPKRAIFFLICLLAVALAIAQSENADPVGISEPAGSDQEPAQTKVTTENKGEDIQIQNQQQVETNNPEAGEQVNTQEQTQLQSGSYTTEEGKQVRVEEKTNNRIEIRSGEATAESAMEMTQQQTEQGTKLQVQLSNGRNAEVKIMPDTASERAIERLELKNCVAEEGCTIELKEVGQGEQVKAAYEVKAEKQVRVLGLFKAKMQVEAQVDAENGEVIKTRGPWWAFLTVNAEE
ncbi:hypothetical protein KY320_04010 [Candidatus Woesearchaeota archaeon]|nr:hypothetical protein [Candidatus Woesearchaeota archaeon]